MIQVDELLGVTALLILGGNLGCSGCSDSRLLGDFLFRAGRLGTSLCRRALLAEGDIFSQSLLKLHDRESKIF